MVEEGKAYIETNTSEMEKMERERLLRYNQPKREFENQTSPL